MDNPSTDTCSIRPSDRHIDNGRMAERGAGILLRAWLHLRYWRFERRAIRHLESLEDHRLDDIGIERSEITAAVRGLLERRESPVRFGNGCRATDSRQHFSA